MRDPARPALPQAAAAAVAPAVPPMHAASDAAIERARALLASGRALVDEVGREADAASSDPLSAMQVVGDDTKDLMAINGELLPLLLRLKSRGGSRWWRWFTGETLERQVLVDKLGGNVAPLVESGQRLHATLLRHVALLREERERMADRIRWLKTEANAAMLLCDKAWAPACHAAGLDRHDLERLARRAANLDTLAAAMQLSRGQFQLAVASAQAAADRYAEIRTVLLPLWKQSLGLSAMARRPSSTHSRPTRRTPT